MGPLLQYSNEKPADPIELRIYRGADGHFTFYEDEGDTYDYEKGQYATIPIVWHDSSHKLEIGTRTGSFPGMSKEHTFNVVVVSKGHGAGVDIANQFNSVVHYTGKAMQIVVN